MEAPNMAVPIYQSRVLVVLLSGISLLLCVSATLAEDEAADATTYDLRYKLAAGETLRYEVEHRASIRSTIDETTQAAQTQTNSVKAWKVTDVLPNGEIEFIN